MQFSHIIALIAATAVYALPHDGHDGGKTSNSGKASTQVCGNGNKLSCCNSQSNGSLLNVLGSLCTLSVPIIGVPIQSTCGAQQPMCCSTNQDVRLQSSFNWRHSSLMSFRAISTLANHASQSRSRLLRSSTLYQITPRRARR